jgi:hypothetical protein
MRKEAQEDYAILKQHLNPKHFHMLWKDELGDIFLLTKKMEVYLYSETTLGCYCWHDRTFHQLKKSGLISHVMVTDYSIIAFRISIKNLPLILSLGVFRRRPHCHGKWVKEKENILGHRIILFRPDTGDKKE